MNKKLSVEWFVKQISENNIFCFEINKNDFDFLKYKKCLISETQHAFLIVGKPIRIKKNGDIGIIYNDYCLECGGET